MGNILFISGFISGENQAIFQQGIQFHQGHGMKKRAEVYESMPSLTKKLKESLSKEEIKAFRQNRNQSFFFPMLQKSILISGA
jgi:hypothetical protein